MLRLDTIANLPLIKIAFVAQVKYLALMRVGIRGGFSRSGVTADNVGGTGVRRSRNTYRKRLAINEK